MNPIYWLISKQPRHLSNHYILKVKEKFMVCTTKPIKGLKSHFISNSNIAGEPKNQYIIENIHNVNTEMVITTAEKGAAFYAKHQDKIDPLIQKLLE